MRRKDFYTNLDKLISSDNCRAHCRELGVSFSARPSPDFPLPNLEVYFRILAVAYCERSSHPDDLASIMDDSLAVQEFLDDGKEAELSVQEIERARKAVSLELHISMLKILHSLTESDQVGRSLPFLHKVFLTSWIDSEIVDDSQKSERSIGATLEAQDDQKTAEKSYDPSQSIDDNSTQQPSVKLDSSRARTPERPSEGSSKQAASAALSSGAPPDGTSSTILQSAAVAAGLTIGARLRGLLRKVDDFLPQPEGPCESMGPSKLVVSRIVVPSGILAGLASLFLLLRLDFLSTVVQLPKAASVSPRQVAREVGGQVGSEDGVTSIPDVGGPEQLGEHRLSISDIQISVVEVKSGAECIMPKCWAMRQERNLLVNFWGSWCAPCIPELPWLQDLADSLGSQAVVVGIAYEQDERTPMERVRSVLDKQNVTYPNYLIQNSSIYSMVFPEYTEKYPAFAVFGKDGSLRSRFVGALSGPEQIPILRTLLTSPKGLEPKGLGALSTDCLQSVLFTAEELDWSIADIGESTIAPYVLISRNLNVTLELLLKKVALGYERRRNSLAQFTEALDSLTRLSRSTVRISNQLRHEEPALAVGNNSLSPLSSSFQDVEPLYLYIDPTCSSCVENLRIIQETEAVCYGALPPIYIRYTSAANSSIAEMMAALQFLDPENHSLTAVELIHLATSIPSDFNDGLRQIVGFDYSETTQRDRNRARAEVNENARKILASGCEPPLLVYRDRPIEIERSAGRHSTPYNPFKSPENLYLALLAIESASGSGHL